MPIILNKVKKLLELQNKLNIDVDILRLYVQQAYDEACGYCNQLEMPEESYDAITFLCYTNIINQYEKPITSMSEGGRSVSFGTLTSEGNKQSALKGLNRWRIVRAY